MIVQSRVGVGPEPRLRHVPAVELVRVRVELRVALGELRVGPVSHAALRLATEAARRQVALLVPAADRSVGALGDPGALGDDVDDAVDGVRAPQRRPGAADHLDAVDVVEECVLHVPVDTGEQGGIDAPPVDEDEQRPGQGAREAPHPDRPGVRVDAGDLHAGHETKKLRDVRCAGAPDVLRGDHLNGGGGIHEPFRPLGDRRHLHVHHGFDSDGGEIGRRILAPGHVAGPGCRCQQRQDQCSTERAKPMSHGGRVWDVLERGRSPGHLLPVGFRIVAIARVRASAGEPPRRPTSVVI